jgi:hypothetical protein
VRAFWRKKRLRPFDLNQHSSPQLSREYKKDPGYDRFKLELLNFG